jgi:uncharacterized paraquat-inducible protein A
MIERRDDPEDIICYRCGCWHNPPQCNHNPSAPCQTCGKSVGLRCFGSVDGECWRCTMGIPLRGAA